MPTTKQRINLSVPADVNRALRKLATRDKTSVATKTLDLVRLALEIEEDAILVEMVAKREKAGGKFVTHERVWT